MSATAAVTVDCTAVALNLGAQFAHQTRAEFAQAFANFLAVTEASLVAYVENCMSEELPLPEIFDSIATAKQFYVR